jgi:hypothetical protein
MRPRSRALIASAVASAVLVLGGGPVMAASPGVHAFEVPADETVTTAGLRPIVVADEHVQTDEEEATEVRVMLLLVGALAVLTVVVGVLTARRR